MQKNQKEQLKLKLSSFQVNHIAFSIENYEITKVQADRQGRLIVFLQQTEFDKKIKKV